MMYAMHIICAFPFSSFVPGFLLKYVLSMLSLSNSSFSIQILTTLKRNLDTPITCKIRLLKSSQDTVELARRIEKTGVSALAVHGR